VIFYNHSKGTIYVSGAEYEKSERDVDKVY